MKKISELLLAEQYEAPLFDTLLVHAKRNVVSFHSVWGIKTEGAEIENYKIILMKKSINLT
jgi:hypothetical protein